MTELTVVGVFDVDGGEVVEFAVEAFVVEPHPPAGGDLEIVEPAPVPAVAGEDGGLRCSSVVNSPITD